MTDPDITPFDPARKVGDSTVMNAIGRPPDPGSSLGEVIQYYTEIAPARVPGFDMELIPLRGKNPRVNGPGWQDLASSDPLSVLDQVKAAGSVDGFGALMNKHIAFDVDHPEELPHGLLTVFEQGLQSSTRPGRTHYIFRVPEGRRFGGSQAELSRAYGVAGKWGEIKAWNQQIRIWSPNDDGTHVALQPGPIPELPIILLGLLQAPLADGETLPSAEFEDWLDGHTEDNRPGFLKGDLERFHERLRTQSKYEAMVSTSMHLAGNVSAGYYPGRTAYDALLDEYQQVCTADGDWDSERQRKYHDAWRGAAAKHSRDPGLIRSAEEKRLKFGGIEDLTDDEHDLFEQMAAVMGVTYAGRVRESETDTDEDMVQRLLDAPSDPEESPMDENIAEEKPAPERAVEPDTGLAMRMLRERVRVLKTEAADLATGDAATVKAYERMNALVGQLEQLSEEQQEKWIRNILSKTPDALAALLEDLARAQSRNEALDLLREVKMSAVGQRVEPVGLELTWRKIVPPDTLRRTDGIGLLNSSDRDGHGVFHNLIGGKGSGKSTLAMAACIEVLRDGGRVAWVDFEQGPDPVANMLMTLGAPREAADPGRFAYIDMKTNAGAMIQDALNAISALPEVPNLIVIDSLSRAIVRVPDLVEAAENSSQSLINLVDSFVSRLTTAGSSVLMISHVGHTDKTRTRGSSAIGDQADVEYSVEVLTGWSRETEGATLITTRKARFGFHEPDEPAAVVVYRPDLGVADPLRRPLSVTLLPPTDTAAMAWQAAGEEERGKTRAAKKARDLETKRETVESSIREVISCLSAGEKRSTNEMWDEVRGFMDSARKQDVSDCLKLLHKRGEVTMETAGQAFMWGRP